MHVITQSCVLFLWMTFVKSQDCTREKFINSGLFDSNFDISNLEASYAGGKQVRVGCNIGYTGFFKLICVEGKWQSRGTKCEPRSCGHPGDAQFADFYLDKGDDFVFGSKVVYTCHKGYQMVSRTNFRRCMAEGWDGVVPVCEAQQCPVIHVDNNVQVIGDTEEAIFGNVIRFSCKFSNEILFGSSEIYCDDNGQWNEAVPKCKAIKCSVPDIENGRVIGEMRDYNEHEVLHYECNKKYTRAEERPSKCTKFGLRAEWSPTPLCEPTKCKLPTALEGTTYQTSYRNVFSPGDTLTVMCGEKYWINHPTETSAVTTCNDDGTWSIRPVCQEVICSNRRENDVDYWDVYRWQRITLGDTVRYRCRQNYKSTDGSYRAVCHRDGWRPKPLCQEIICDRLEIPNADISYSNKMKYKNNERVNYVCNEGYTGNPTRTCGENGWVGNSQCTEITCDRRYFENADIEGESQLTYRYKDQVEYVCKGGFVGRFNLTCGKDGWTKSSQCISIQCEKLDIKNAHIIRNDKQKYAHLERVSYACQNDRDERFTIICKEGVWTGIQSCTACPKAEVPNGFIVGPYNSSTLYYSCNQGYKPYNKGWWSQATCKDRVWAGLEQCIDERACGGIPVIPNGNMPRQHYLYQHSESVQITCKEGFQAQIDRLICQEGKWNANGLAFKTICRPLASNCKAPPRVANAVVVGAYKKQYLSDSEVIYQCRDNYTMEGESRLRCKDGEWEEVNITCHVTCPALPDVPHAYVSEETKKSEYREGHVIHFNCETGYVSGPTIRYVCTSLGWEGIRTGKCFLKPCQLPEDTPNGYYQIIRGQDFVFGAVIRYFCNEGYQMVSKDDTRTCLLNKWTNHVPICDPFSCDPPPADEKLTVRGLTDNDEPILPDRFLTFSCEEPGTYLNGSSRLICGKDGQWDNPFPSCEEITCKVGMVHPYLDIIGLPANEKVKTGHRLQFQCSHEYVLQGSQELECLPTGQWNAPFPTCSDKCRVPQLPYNVFLRTHVPNGQLSKGQKLRFDCRLRGHYLHGNEEVECLAGGRWSSPFPTCGAPANCGRPPYLPDGDIEGTSKFEYAHGESVKYICQNLYEMAGVPYKICHNGQWTGEMRCLKPCTVNEELMRNHNIEFKYSDEAKLYAPHNDQLQFRCVGRTRHDGRVSMAQKCLDGVINLPTCH
uniref:complement factor H-like n=1 Tax=Scatophagus argus TaxID=75038 RepID=UPI001ED80880|nr:complement factor H-like [Scatophagus argus]